VESKRLRVTGKGNGGTFMNRKWLLVIGLILLIAMVLVACSKAPKEKAKEKEIKVGPVKMVSHPSTLEGKAVLLRWNGKPNGDHFLNRVAELLTDQVKGVKIIKMWEVDKSTAVISGSLEKSEAFAEKIIELKPDIVVSTQAD
jgi:ABC-type Fe3+-hydroxamate transport system substrate-binding protein